MYIFKKGNCSVHSDNRLAVAVAYIDVPRESEQDLMEAVATVGPVSVAIDAGDIGLQFYSYGTLHQLGIIPLDRDQCVVKV